MFLLGITACTVLFSQNWMLQEKGGMTHFCLITLILLDEFVQPRSQVCPRKAKHLFSHVIAHHRFNKSICGER